MVDGLHLIEWHLILIIIFAAHDFLRCEDFCDLFEEGVHLYIYVR